MEDSEYKCNKRFEFIESRLDKVEEWRIIVDIDRARREIDTIYIKEKFDGLEKSLNEFKSRIDTISSRFLWAIITPVIVVIINFILSGKLLN